MRTTSHPVAWFAFGVYASCVAASSLGAVSGDTSGRWSGEAGFLLGHALWGVGAAFLCGVFATWLVVRGRWVGPIRPAFAVPLALGLAYMAVVVGLVMALHWSTGHHWLADYLVPVITLGMPAAMAEITVRWARRRSAKPGPKAGRDPLDD